MKMGQTTVTTTHQLWQFQCHVVVPKRCHVKFHLFNWAAADTKSGRQATRSQLHAPRRFVWQRRGRCLRRRWEWPVRPSSQAPPRWMTRCRRRCWWLNLRPPPLSQRVTTTFPSPAALQRSTTGFLLRVRARRSSRASSSRDFRFSGGRRELGAPRSCSARQHLPPCGQNAV